MDGGEAVWRDSRRHGIGNGSNRCLRVSGGSGPNSHSCVPHSQVPSPTHMSAKEEKSLGGEDQCEGTRLGWAVPAMERVHLCYRGREVECRGLVGSSTKTGSRSTLSLGVAKATQAVPGYSRCSTVRERDVWAVWPADQILHGRLHFSAPRLPGTVEVSRSFQELLLEEPQHQKGRKGEAPTQYHWDFLAKRTEPRLFPSCLLLTGWK